MKTFFYIIISALGIAISLPITVFLIAYEQALNTKSNIKDDFKKRKNK